ncbi:hypothetical protein XarbCFBP7408_02595 [Xanthomonas arboricola pv. guizotiae]|uniref:Uncharacterized protein n=1 Tax=Xanthomonas arboricola pv. guizotiae TaxID=487867 RepID=A0A2S7A7C6_9XANT|nr:hypothetical protein XarbCFBP7409_01075 [Xanthomonas arboricola pv. guizotiae]PPU26550.1 hypothetical protein XarbCFBP7408_02595 [Xanthomonas arboricola pv. guizotiae]
MSCPACPRTPTISIGPCPLTVAGPYAAWMPRKRLICSECGSVGVESRREPHCESIPGSSVGGIHAAKDPASGEDTAPES